MGNLTKRWKQLAVGGWISLLSCNFSLFASESLAPPLRSGWDLRKPTAKEIQEYLNKKSKQEKAAIAWVQLKEILPPVIFKHVPPEILEKCRFSIADDHAIRTKKYLQLALLVRDLMQKNTGITTDKNLWKVIYTSYIKAFDNLKQIEGSIAVFERPDYFLSLAQIEIWAARSLMQKDLSHLKNDKDRSNKIINMAFEALSYLKEAESGLGNLPGDETIEDRMIMLQKIVDKGLERLVDSQFVLMADNPLTKLMVASDSEIESMHSHFVEAKIDKVKKDIDSAQQSKTVKEGALKIYRAKRYEKIEKIILPRTRLEKIAALHTQDVHFTYSKLMELHLITSEDKHTVEAYELLQVADYLAFCRPLLLKKDAMKSAYKTTVISNEYIGKIDQERRNVAMVLHALKSNLKRLEVQPLREPA